MTTNYSVTALTAAIDEMSKQYEAEDEGMFDIIRRRAAVVNAGKLFSDDACGRGVFLL